MLTAHREHLPLSATSVDKRQYQYRELFKINLVEEDLHVFRRAVHYSVPVGSDRFMTHD